MALKGFLPPSSQNIGSAIVKASTRKVAIKKSSDQKSSPTGTLTKSFKKSDIISPQKKNGILTKSFIKSDIISPQKKNSALVKDKNKDSEIEEQIKRVEVKVIKLQELFKDRSTYDKVKSKKEKRNRKNEEKIKREKDLENNKKPNKFNIGKFSSLMPKTGILDAITNFLLYTVLGYLNNRFDIIPKLIGLIPMLTKTMDFVINIGGFLLEGLVTFIDFGYGLVDKTRGFIKALGGDGAAKAFDKFLSTLNILFNLALVAALVNAKGGFGGKKGKGGKPGKSGKPRGKPGTGGRPKVTTSGGKGAGKPDIRNPLRNKPPVTTSGGGGAGKPNVRNPLRGKPPVTTGGGGGGGGGGLKLPRLPKGLKARGGLLGLAFLIPDIIDAGMLAKEGRGKDGLRTLANAVAGTATGFAASGATLAGATALGLTGVGLPAAIALGIASLGVGAVAGSAAYSASDAVLRKTGLQDTDPKTGKPYQYSLGGLIGKANAGLSMIGGMMSLPPIPKLTLPNLTPQSIGNSITGGFKSLFALFGLREDKKDEPPSYLKGLIKLGNKVKDVPLIGGAMYAAIQLAMGSKVDRRVLGFVGGQLTNFSNLDAFKGISSSASKLSSALQFASGGQISSTVVSLSPSDNRKSIISLSNYLDREIQSIELELDKEKEKEKDPQDLDGGRDSGGGGGGGGGGGEDGEDYDKSPHGTPGPAVKATSGFNPGKGDKSKRIFLHWTASDHSKNFNNYHTTFLGNGTAVRNRGYGVDGTEHTAGANTNSVGLSIAAMKDGEENKFGAFPPTSAQVSAMSLEAARLAVAWGWDESTIDKNVITHGEWERYATKSGILPGSPQRWDLDKLKQSDPMNSGGNKLRKMIKSYFKQLKAGASVDSSGKVTSKTTGKPIAQMSLDTAMEMVEDKNYNPDTNVSGGNADFWTLSAIASLESGNSQGQADVAQAVYNRVASKANFGQGSNHTVKGHILAKNQFQPVRETRGGYDTWSKITDKKTAIAALSAHPRGRNAAKMIDDSAANIRNTQLRKNSADFVGGRTDFATPSAANKDPDGFGYKERHGHLYGWYVGPGAVAYGKKNPGPAQAPNLGNISVSSTGNGKPPKSGSEGSLGGTGNFIQGNSGDSRGIHFHIGPGSQEKGTGTQSRYNADARTTAKQVVKHFLGKKSMTDGRRENTPYTSGSDAEVKAAQDAHTYGYNGRKPGSQGGIDIQVGGAYYPGAKVPFPLNTQSMKFRPGGFGVSADISGSNSFVAHGYKDEMGKVASQDGGMGNLYGSAQGGGYIGKNPKVYGGINESASYEQSGMMIMIQPMIIEKSSPSMSRGGNMDKITFAGSGSVNSVNPAAERG